MAKFKAEQIDTGKRTAADGFGSREFLKNNYLARMNSVALGIYGNSKEEAIFPFILPMPRANLYLASIAINRALPKTSCHQ